MATLLEQTRAAHEEMERLERLIVSELSRDARSHRERLAQGHRVRAMVDRICDRAAKLGDTYEDKDGARKEEIAALGGGENVFSAFYDRLKEVRDAHRHFPNVLAPGREVTDAALAEEVRVEFTGEEGSGRYLDLHELFRMYTNAPFGAKTDYLAYLDGLATLHAVPRPKRFHASYSTYLTALTAYLLDFRRRAAPLTFTVPILARAREVFAAAWDAGTVAGWEDRGVGHGERPEGTLDLDVFETADELLTLGSEALKDALTRLGLKAGGTDAERAARLFSTKGKRLDELYKKLFVRGAAPPADQAAAARAVATARAIAALEADALCLLEQLRDVLKATRGNVEKKTTLSYQELEAERMEEEADQLEEGEEPENEAIYNPLKLPLGWDGKPIPYWLYKLHGLNQEFNCEICGNFSYWGRRAYERHFREPRHQHGMRCLKIPNTKAFLEVTTIADALALHKAMQERGATSFKADADEEFEDASGNVYNKKTYLDLQRQGLL